MRCDRHHVAESAHQRLMGLLCRQNLPRLVSLMHSIGRNTYLFYVIRSKSCTSSDQAANCHYGRRRQYKTNAIVSNLWRARRGKDEKDQKDEKETDTQLYYSVAAFTTDLMTSLLASEVINLDDSVFSWMLTAQRAVHTGEDWDLVSLAIDAAIDGMDALPSEYFSPRHEEQFSKNRSSHNKINNTNSNRRTSQDDGAQVEHQGDRGDDDDDDDDGDERDDDAEDVAATKRLRHREAMQRCRERKRSRMGVLEKQQRKLKVLLRTRLIEHQQREQLLAAQSDGTPSSLATARSVGLELLPLDSIQELRKLFTHAVRLKEELLDERHTLEQLLRGHQKYERLVVQSTTQIMNEPKEHASSSSLSGFDHPTPRDTTDQNPYSQEEYPSSSGRGSQETQAATADTQQQQKKKSGLTGHWVEYLDHEDPLFYEPEPVEAMDEHIRECYQRVQRLKLSFATRHSHIQETHCLGWTAHHTLVRLENPTGLELRFRFSRRVPLQRMPLDDLQQATWALMKDPVQNARLYSSVVVCKIVQFVGKDTFIFIRNSPDKDKRMHIRYFSMHSQMEYRTDANERSYVTLMKILDKEPHLLAPSEGEQPRKPQLPVIWLKQGTLFLNFTEKLATSEMELEYGGSVQCMSDAQAQYLLIEVGGMLMRWEQMVIPQRLLQF